MQIMLFLFKPLIHNIRCEKSQFLHPLTVLFLLLLTNSHIYTPFLHLNYENTPLFMRFLVRDMHNKLSHKPVCRLDIFPVSPFSLIVELVCYNARICSFCYFQACCEFDCRLLSVGADFVA